MVTEQKRKAGIKLVEVLTAMIDLIKKSLTCKDVTSFNVNTTLRQTHIPRNGDVGIFRVTSANGGSIMDTARIVNTLFDDDLVMLVFGNRYATNQYEGYVPHAPVTECQILGRGGVAGLLKSKNDLFKFTPPQLEMVAYATDNDDRVLNTMRLDLLDAFSPDCIRSKVILSIGSSMDSGKTTTAAWLCGGLKRTSHRVAFLKLTGTTFPKDISLVLSRGANFAADFSHFGFPSTYLLEKQLLLNLYQSLVNIACHAVSPDYIVVEIADGLLQRETALLLNDSQFMRTVHSVILSCSDSLGVLSGLQLLEKINIRPFAVSGLLTASQLSVDEVQQHVAIPVLRLNDLLNGQAEQLLENKSSEPLQGSTLACKSVSRYSSDPTTRSRCLY